MTEPTPDVHRRRLDGIAFNAVNPVLAGVPVSSDEPWWLPLGARMAIGRAVVQALDAQPEPAADTETTTPLTDHQEPS